MLLIYVAFSLPALALLSSLAVMVWLGFEFLNDHKFDKWYKAIIEWRESGMVGEQPELEDFGYKR